MERGLLKWMLPLCVALVPAAQARAQATLVADAHVSIARPGVNAGSLTNLNVGGGYTTLLQFDLSLLPQGATAAQVTRAMLRVYCNRADTPGLVAVQPVNGAWTEAGLTYATLPPLGAPMQTAQVSSADQFVTFDITTTVQAWVAGTATNNGLALAAGSAVLQFDSKENDQTAHAAELQIVLAAGGSGSVGPQGPKGDRGDTGAAGPQGLTGPAGPQGPAGLTGATGAAATIKIGSVTTLPAGSVATVVNSGSPAAAVLNFAIPQGAMGAAGTGGGSAGGFVYRGAYQPTATYALGEVVVFAGSSYTSLVASNQGNTPALSPDNWGLVAQVGAAGPQGQQGLTGLQGQAGAAGIQGPTGPAGPGGLPGPTGARGTPGLVYQGQYQSTSNYALGDVVVFAGSSWASLEDMNHGNTPGLSPAYWGILTSQGPQGPQGATGASGAPGPQGAPGSVGPPGERGDTGAQGPAGQAGAQGIPGTKGDAGLSGPAGPQGIAGPVGMTFRGPYSSVANYALADGVLYNGTGYVSLVAGNRGNTPDQSPTQWAVFATGTAGSQGTPGAVGPAGPAGASGSPGPQGPTGERGETGARGVGLTPRGIYSSITGYITGDVVSYGGSGYTSLVDNNHGQTPDQSPEYWSLIASKGDTGLPGASGLPGATGPAGLTGPPGATGLAGTPGPKGDTGLQGPAGAQGLTGSAGPAGDRGSTGQQGPPGQAGAQGIPGAAGSQGAQGPAGSQGADGAVGLSFRGPYDSTLNYAAGDGVLWQGAGYVSLVAGNHGNTPDQSPAAWGLFATGAAGAAGAKGDRGDPGPQGIQGPGGAMGLQGLQGVQGASGPRGDRGDTGLQGLAGPPGATGSAGPQGITGADGVPGAAGPQGLVGPAGLTGSTGATGPQGQGLTPRGPYSSSTGYVLGDVVGYAGSGYISIVNNNQGQTPDQSPTYWSLIVTKGETGLPGAAGATGAQGPIGLTGPGGTPGAPGAPGPKGDTGLQGATGAQGLPGATGGKGDKGDTGAQGSAGSAGAQGVPGAAGTTGPAGPQGSQGPQGGSGPAGATGPAGAVGINFRGAWLQGTHYSARDTVTFAGSTYLAESGTTNDEPDISPSIWTVLAQAGGAGPTGAAGTAGTAATVAIGTVTTLAPGSAVTVTNTGTANAAVLNFGIPQGAMGTGSGSGTPTSGSTFAAVYHAVSFSTAFYSVNLSNASASETATVLTWVPRGCSAVRLDAYSQQSNTVTVTLRNGTPGAMSDTALSCAAASGSTCSATGNITVTSGSFLDLSITGPSGTPAAVWTALECN